MKRKIEKSLVGRKKIQPNVDDKLATDFEYNRVKKGIRISDLPVSQPTYRKCIIDGVISPDKLEVLKQFLLD
jgi:hypothetical protein